MTNGDVSDASPPRRRARREDADHSSSRPLTSLSVELRDHPTQPHLRQNATGSKLRSRKTFQSFETGKEYENISGDVSDASPPRRRRRTNERTYSGPEGTSASDRNYIDRDEKLSRRPHQRETPPDPSLDLRDDASIRSAAISSRNQNLEGKGHRLLSAVGTNPSSTTLRAPPNRFGIRPGPRWDGVNRSNGFEDRLEAMRSMRRDVEVEGYRASVADL